MACAPVPDHAIHDVEYYRQHAIERDSQLARCANDPGTLGFHPDCVNAREAARVEGVGSLQALPPLDLPLPSSRQPGK
jgi:hypothetical protein